MRALARPLGAARITLALALLALASLAACAPVCPSSSELVARIEALERGERIELGACVISESVAVPAGATVEGGSFELSEGASIALVPSADGAPVTTLRGALVRGGSDSGVPSVRVAGAGRARIEASVLEIERGLGIGVSGAKVELADVELRGSFDPARVLELSDPLVGVATYGVAAIEGAALSMTGGAVERFASAGVVCVGASVAIAGARVAESRGIGVESFACELALTDVTVHDTVAAPGLPGVGVLAAMGTTLEATRLVLRDAPGYGLVASASHAALDAPRIERMAQAGAWAEGGASLTIVGGMLTENAGAAIAAVGASRLEVRDTRVDATRPAPLPSPGGGGADTLADAIHVAQREGTPCTVALADVTLADNARVGLVLDGAMQPLALSIARTRVETSGTELGAIAQNVAALPSGWDADLVRVGSAATLDAAAGLLVVSTGSGLAGILMPPTITF